MDFPGGPVVKTPHSHCRGHGFDPWSGKLRSHMPCGSAKSKNRYIHSNTIKHYGNREKKEDTDYLKNNCI